jgi:hypothetical protein
MLRVPSTILYKREQPVDIKMDLGLPAASKTYLAFSAG